MSRFLLTSDYSSIIQTIDLNQITENTIQNLYDSEAKAISRMRTKLVQRYMVDIELGGMVAYNVATHYRIKDRVLQTGNVIYSVKEFDTYVNTTAYALNDIVCDSDGYVYTAAQASTDKPLTNTTYWTAMINVVNTNTTYWQQVDNRYPLFVEIAMDLTLYNLYARINPRNIPDLRKERNREALDQLDAWSSGTDTAEVLEINTTEQTGFSIRYGSSLEKQNNLF
jgi:hypothetical protein